MKNSNINLIMKENSILKRSARMIWIIYSSIVSICIAALAIINSTWIYKLVVKKYNLVSVTGISEEALMNEYRGLINYLQNPFINKLNFNNFDMSTYGEVHFYEVKKIFISLMIIVVIFIVTLLGYFIFNRYQKRTTNIIRLLNSFNSSANLLIVFFIGIVTLYFIDFSWAFTMFHKIFFRNNYWIFDPKIDPIIIALPEELFMICGGAILALLVIMIVSTKWAYYKNRSNIKLYAKNKEIDL